MDYYKNIYKTIGKTLDYIENIDIKELQSFEKASAKYFYNNSLKNISKEITKIIIK